MGKKLVELLSNLGEYKIQGSEKVWIDSIVDDSRKTFRKGSLFVAISGLTFDAHDYIDSVVSKGAIAVVGEKDPKNLKLEGATYIKVPNSRKALGLLASAWYDNPSRNLEVIGVTGTDGKTTTATLIYWILKTTGKKTGLISTVSAKIGNKEYDTGFHVTNPEPLALQKFLALMVKRGCEYAVLEITSHGLDQDRVAGINFEVSVLTNITHEHLDYHKTYTNYIRAKAKLFANSKIAVLNKEDNSFEKIKKLLPKKVKVINYGLTTLQERLKKAIEERFPEEYNRLNASGALTVTSVLGISERNVLQSIKLFPGITGRMEEIKNKRGIRIIVDFAHTPNALKQVLTSLRKLVTDDNRLIAVFGCAGERDVDKRHLMGEISAKTADISIFTAEDPRSEDVGKIIDEMAKGARKSGGKFIKIPERGEAIYFAIQKLAEKGDTVVICGKGHEKSMAYAKIEYPWSDQEAVKLALAGKVKTIKR